MLQTCSIGIDKVQAGFVIKGFIKLTATRTGRSKYQLLTVRRPGRLTRTLLHIRELNQVCAIDPDKIKLRQARARGCKHDLTGFAELWRIWASWGFLHGYLEVMRGSPLT